MSLNPPALEDVDVDVADHLKVLGLNATSQQSSSNSHSLVYQLITQPSREGESDALPSQPQQQNDPSSQLLIMQNHPSLLLHQQLISPPLPRRSPSFTIRQFTPGVLPSPALDPRQQFALPLQSLPSDQQFQQQSPLIRQFTPAILPSSMQHSIPTPLQPTQLHRLSFFSTQPNSVPPAAYIQQQQPLFHNQQLQQQPSPIVQSPSLPSSPKANPQVPSRAFRHSFHQQGTPLHSLQAHFAGISGPVSPKGQQPPPNQIMQAAPPPNPHPHIALAGPHAQIARAQNPTNPHAQQMALAGPTQQQPQITFIPTAAPNPQQLALGGNPQIAFVASNPPIAFVPGAAQAAAHAAVQAAGPPFSLYGLNYLHFASPPSYNNFTADITQVPHTLYYSPFVYHSPQQQHAVLAAQLVPQFIGGGGQQQAPGVFYQGATVGGGVGPPPGGYPGGGAVQSGGMVVQSPGIGGGQAVMDPTMLPHTAAPPRRDWYATLDGLLQLAHQKYNSQDFNGALTILQDLYQLNRTHLPTLLLLGCTCYSLGLHQLSVSYNNLILSIDPKFAEAYSNLGTTYRAMAQQQQQQQQQITDSSGAIAAPLPAPHEAIELAENYYRRAISIRPKYWDASINLAGLLSSQGRWREAIEVYDGLERLMEEEFRPEDRMHLLSDSADVADEATIVRVGCEMERRRKAFLAYTAQQQQCADGRSNADTATSYTVERRRDLYYSKGNLYYAMGEIVSAKKEYLKGLVSVGLDVSYVYTSTGVALLPAPTVTPQQSQAVYQQYHTGGGAIRNVVDSVYNSTTSSILQTLAKIYQDANQPHIAVSFYYLSLSVHPTANTCNNLGILLAQQRLNESIQWYEFGLSLDPSHVHLYTNLGSALKDRGQVSEGIWCYQRAITLQPDFFIALANLANVYKDLGRVEESIELYRRALKVKPDFVEAFCNFVNSLLFVCDWEERGEHLDKVRGIVERQLKGDGTSAQQQQHHHQQQQQAVRLGRKGVGLIGVPTVLPFHTFTYASLSAWMIREISRRNADRVLYAVTTSDWFPGFPERPGLLAMKVLQETGILKQIVESVQVHGDGIGRVLEDLGLRRLGESVVVHTRRAMGSKEAVRSAMVQSAHYPYPYELPPPPSPHIRVGYVSSDFNNHPLAHLMQSVFGLHDRSRFRVYCYSLSPTDNSPYRAKIERESDVFVDVSGWSLGDVVHRIASVDRIHVLCNLNGYTKGGRNEIFAARPAPVQMAFMGFAGTMGAGEVYDPSYE
ncbi:hypothetical protein BJ742DRAFT_713483, partial [Cladochytrium replicatum]